QQESNIKKHHIYTHSYTKQTKNRTNTSAQELANGTAPAQRTTGCTEDRRTKEPHKPSKRIINRTQQPHKRSERWETHTQKIHKQTSNHQICRQTNNRTNRHS